MVSTTFRKQRRLEEDGITITVGPRGFNVHADDRWDGTLLQVEVYREGLLLKKATLLADDARDFLGDVNPAECGVRIVDAATDVVLASMDVELDPYPFMRRTGEQVHITENYVAVPPALTITDEVGAVWTLGMTIAPEHKSPDGEFAFPVLRDGLNTGEIASRIERRNGKVKIFTVKGWKSWTGSSFF